MAKRRRITPSGWLGAIDSSNLFALRRSIIYEGEGMRDERARESSCAPRHKKVRGFRPPRYLPSQARPPQSLKFGLARPAAGPCSRWSGAGGTTFR